jgi:hypothetical protein
MRQSDVLETVAWAEKHFGSLTTNRQCTRREVRRAVQAGLVRSVGLVEMRDDDGGTFYSSRGATRVREGFVLTDAGRERVRAGSPATTGGTPDAR